MLGTPQYVCLGLPDWLRHKGIVRLVCNVLALPKSPTLPCGGLLSAEGLSPLLLAPSVAPGTTGSGAALRSLPSTPCTSDATSTSLRPRRSDGSLTRLTVGFFVLEFLQRTCLQWLQETGAVVPLGVMLD